MTNHARRADDTVEIGLADDLLGPADDAQADPSGSTPDASTPAAEPKTWSDLSDDEDYLAPAGRRSRLTTGLFVALIFLVGILVGTVLTRALAPTPAPQIVYVLSSGSPAPTASASPTR